MYNVDQLLFEHCTAKFSDNTQCCVPVFDICHELPLCPEHAKKRDNYNKMASEPKPKKPRKKSKPSALTRPPKRGKKKKRQNQLRPTPTSSPPADQLSNSSQTEMSKSLEHDNEISETENNVSSVALTKDLGGNIDTELATDLEEQFSPGTIDKSLELPLDTVELANQATKLLEEHDFTEVLNKIPDDAFSDLFSEARNGEYIPSKEETEELERALAAVSKDVHLAKESLAKLSATGQDIDELAGTIDIHGGLLSADNLAGAIDENAFHELAQGPMEGLGVISNSLSTSDLNSLSQALSSITSDNLAQSTLTTSVTEGHLHNPLASVPVLTSEVAHTQVLNGLAGIHAISPESGFGMSTQYMEGSASTQNSVENRYLPGTPSLLSSILYGLGQNNSSSQTSYPTSQLPTPSNGGGGGGGREEENSAASTGGPSVANSSGHWLLNSSEQVLALSQMNYQNGFLVTSQAGAAYSATQQLLTSVGKYPLQALSAEVSLVSGSATSTRGDGATCGASDELLHNLHASNSATGTLQQTNGATVIAQEGAS
ncbi:INO80 complex subunit D-like [Centruroides vittatus]